MKISQLKDAPYNPRKISEKSFSALAKSMSTFGDIAAVTFNRRSGNLVAGHQRKNFIDKITSGKATINILKKYDSPTIHGTVAVGIIEVEGEPFLYREVDWDDVTEKTANIQANNPNATGEYTEELQALLEEIKPLAVEFSALLLPELEVVRAAEPEVDESKLAEAHERYKNGSIKQIVLYFDLDTYEAVYAKLMALQEESGIDDNSQFFIELLNHYELTRDGNNQSKT